MINNTVLSKLKGLFITKRKYKMRKNYYAVRNSDHKTYLKSFLNHAKCKTEKQFISMSFIKRKEIVESYLRLIKVSNTESMYENKIKWLFTYLYKKNKLTTNLKELFEEKPR